MPETKKERQIGGQAIEPSSSDAAVTEKLSEIQAEIEGTPNVEVLEPRIIDGMEMSSQIEGASMAVQTGRNSNITSLERPDSSSTALRILKLRIEKKKAA